MRIAVIGAGVVGSGLARVFLAAGHSVVISSRHPDRAAKVAAEIGAQTVPSNREAATGADLIVLAVPSTAIAGIADELYGVVEGTIVVDPTNPLLPDLSGLLPAEASVAEEIPALMPGAIVVKAFNTVLGKRITDPVVDGVRLDGLYAGDDDAAKATVRELIALAGFRPIDAGPLTFARTLEHLGLLNVSLNARYGWPWESGWKLLGPTG
jgi:8-hydroxy-5-deazaflavin:NADPH oxidoreductase